MRYKDGLYRRLKDNAEAVNYLQAAREDSPAAFLIARKNVLDARKDEGPTIEFERRKDEGHPNFLDVIRMYRKERELSFDEAKYLAIKEFEKRGWPTLYSEKGSGC